MGHHMEKQSKPVIEVRECVRKPAISVDYHRKDPLSSAIDTAGWPSAPLRAGAPVTLCMLSAMAGHPRAGPLLPHRNWGPGEIVGGGKGQGTVDSAAD